MKRLSIKMRITLWYALLMLLVAGVVFGFMLLISNSVVERDYRSHLTSMLTQNLQEIEYEDGALEVDDDFRSFSNGVYASLYSQSQDLIMGRIPNAFPLDVTFQDGEMQTVQVNGARYYVYDYFLAAETGGIWLRNIAASDGSASLVSTVIKISLIAFPLLVVLAALVGYAIARRSFLPIRQMQSAAEAITEGKDLSKRIALPPNKDEIHSLADTFNRMLARLEAAFEAEKRFVSDASHELRTPTSVILAECEYALEEATEHEEYRESLAVIDRQAHKMSRLIGELLSIARLEQGIVKPALEFFNLSEFVAIALEEYAHRKEKGIALTSQIEPNLYARIDRSLMARLLANLIDNAYRYGRQNGHIEVSLTREGNALILRVKDDGPGIAYAEQEKIWQRFYQVNPSRTAQADGGTGLGLSMVKQIAAIHGGTVCVSSTPGKGSVFTLTLPQ